jgi:hypothetical protein
MDKEANEHRKKEIEERRKNLELLRSRRVTRSKDKEAQLRRNKEDKEEVAPVKRANLSTSYFHGLSFLLLPTVGS